MSELNIGRSLVFSKIDTPTREGEVVETVEDIMNIPTPREGMIVYVRSEKKNYVVLSLKEKDINGVNVEKAQVDRYESLDAALIRLLVSGVIKVGLAAAVDNVADSLDVADPKRPLSARCGVVLQEEIDTLNGDGEGSVNKKIATAINTIIDNAPEAYDTLRDIAEWISTHGEEATNLALQIENEGETRKAADNTIKGMAVKAQFGTRKTDAEKVVIDYTSLDDKVSGEIHIPAATKTTAGAMSAKDKSFIDSIAQSEEVDDINDAVLLIVGKSDGTFVRVSPSVLRGVTTQYLTKSDYDSLIALGGIKDNVEYNIIEDE